MKHQDQIYDWIVIGGGCAFRIKTLGLNNLIKWFLINRLMNLLGREQSLSIKEELVTTL